MDNDERLVSNEFHMEDDAELSLRPRTLNEFVGQSALKENLKIFLEAALQRRDTLDHMLFYGPPGLGKTTLASIIANEMGQRISITSGPAIERPGDLAAILSNRSEGDILFIDEIHRLSRSVEEVLYSAMEDFALDIMIGKGPSARSIRVNLPKFTLVGATTRAGLLTAPLRDRFGFHFRLEMYTADELQQIIAASAGKLGVEADADGLYEIARRSRGTPRIANRLLRRVRDYAQVRANGKITLEVAGEGLTRMMVDDLGLDNVDRNILESMMRKFQGGPVGLDTLAASTGEDATTIEDMYEPYLLQLGFIMRTPRGRICTPEAYAHMKIQPPAQNTLSDQIRMALDANEDE